MASVSAAVSTSIVASSTGLPQRRPLGVGSSPVLGGLPAISMKGRVSCTSEAKPTSSCLGMNASLVAAISAAALSSPAMALVDDRMSTEGTGLPFGLSNNLLGWILLGVFGLIWAFYTIYTSSLDEDEDSGLSL